MVLFKRKNRVKKIKEKIEFSKKIFYMITVFTTIVIIFSMLLMWKTQDTSALSYLITAVFGEFATATGFYYWKARSENSIKIKLAHKEHGLNYTEDNEQTDSY